MAAHAKDAVQSGDSDRTISLTRRFDASPEAVFRAWTDPRRLASWIGPRDIAAKVEILDMRPGGAYRIAMHRADGRVSVVAGTYREVVPFERLAFTWAWQEDAATGRMGHESLVTMTLRAVGEATEMTLHQAAFETKTSRDAHEGGWTSTLEKLADFLAGRPIPQPA
jgi:uncharacterized protein YndB with AHSA1/START domain